ncbi:MAG: hypothetical protein QXJ14_02535 [Candidatus Aenigmatarchaeota archaeon]
MVKKARRRIKKYKAGIEPISVYLKIKKYKFIPLKPLFVHSLKDQVFEEILNKYNLNEREKTLSIEAWRELYYTFYETLQKVKIEK